MKRFFSWVARWLGPAEWANDTDNRPAPRSLFDYYDDKHAERFQKQMDDPDERDRWFK